MEAALRFDDLHRRLKLLAGLRNRAPMLHLLHALSDTGAAAAAAAGRRSGGAAGMLMPQMPPRVFSEPSAGLSGIGRVGRASAEAGGYGGRGEAPNGRAPGAAEPEPGNREPLSSRANGQGPVGGGGTVRRARVATTEVTERTLLKGILYAFQVGNGRMPWELACRACG